MDAQLSSPDAGGDGRRQRSEASRRKIVAAMLALVRQGEISPGAEAVAARAGVGLRTVFRHFETMETLYREMNQLMEAEVLPLAEAPFTAAGWRARLDELLERRVRIFETILPVKIAADAHRHESEFLTRDAARIAAWQRRTLKDLLPARLARDLSLFEALDLLLSIESWRRLRRDQKLSQARAKAVVAEALARLIGE